MLLHSGKGTGLSEMLGGAMSTSYGTSLIEKNLDRITVGFAVAFGVSLLLLMIVYPKGLRRPLRSGSGAVTTASCSPCSSVRDAFDWIRVQPP